LFIQDTEEAADELVDMRRKNRNHEEILTGEELSLQTRAHKKLRSRKVHKLTLPAPEAMNNHSMGSTSTGIGTGTGITAGLVQHFEGLSVVEAGPSSSVKKVVHSVSRAGDDSKVGNPCLRPFQLF